jgi:hypothetical protein
MHTGTLERASQTARHAPRRPATTPPRPAAKLPRTSVAVQALHLGTYAFRGGGDTQALVCVTAAALARRKPHRPADDGRAKARVVAHASGVADGATASLPDILPGLLLELESAAEAAAAAAAAAAHKEEGDDEPRPPTREQSQMSFHRDRGGRAGGVEGEPPPQPHRGAGAAAAAPLGYGAWLTRELSRRRAAELGGGGGGDGDSDATDQARSFSSLLRRRSDAPS